MENKIVCEVPRYHGINELWELMSDLVLERQEIQVNIGISLTWLNLLLGILFCSCYCE